MRSSSNRIPPPNNTGNDSKARIAVVNQAQQVSGMRISDIPRVRMLSKRRDEIQRAQQRANAKDRDADDPEIYAGALPGPAIFPSALNGG